MTYLHALRAPARGVLLSEAARLCRLTPRAIRFYEECGLVRSDRGPAGQRQFDEEMLERLGFISQARRIGLSLKEVKTLLDLGDRDGIEAQRKKLGQCCQRLLREIDQRRRQVEGMLEALEDDAAGGPLRAAG